MPNSHIQNLVIKNFKCFEKLEMENIQRVNLIGGKNNVGKTALLEATEILTISSTESDVFSAVAHLLKQRQGENTALVLDIFFEDTSDFLISSKNKKTTLSINNSNNLDPKLTATLNDQIGQTPLNRILTSEGFFNRTYNKAVYFITAFSSNTKDMAILYGELLNWSREGFLDESLSLFDQNISAFRQIVTPNGIMLKLKKKNKDKLILLSSMGEGISRYITILCAIWACKDGVLLIDEIENGIHYTNFPKLWKIIFQASKEANCQVFATSHSKECIEAFNQAQNQYGDGMYFELFQNVKTGRIDISDINQEQLQYSLTHEGAIRGE